MNCMTLFDEHNDVVRLCARGMEYEGLGKYEEARNLFYQAWEDAASDLEWFISAHYIARHQSSLEDKLSWDRAALSFAMQVEDERVKGSYPSLYLNIAKCLEDLKEQEDALAHYELAWSYERFLANDGYGTMIRAGIRAGIGRTRAA